MLNTHDIYKLITGAVEGLGLTPNQSIGIIQSTNIHILIPHTRDSLIPEWSLFAGLMSGYPHSPHWRLSRPDSTWRRPHPGSRGREMVERSGYTSLDILDGDCVRSVATSSCDNSRPASKPASQLRQGQGHLSLGNFFHNEDDSPLLVTSIDGISTQASRVAGPASLSSSTFSLLTPETPQFFVKSRTVSPAKENFPGLSPATPYNSIRKRLKSVSIKYLKSRQKKKPDKADNAGEEETSSTQSKFDFLNIDSKLREISEKCSQLKSEAEESISRMEENHEEEKEKEEEEFSISKTEAQIEFTQRFVTYNNLHDTAALV